MTRRGRQTIRYVTTEDGLRLAWAEAGSGPALVKAGNWLTHLEYDWESPVWRHWTRFFSENFRYIRHDERGCGMSGVETGKLSLASWIGDLERVVEASAVSSPFTLLGISGGAPVSIGYAVKHPERVARLILYGGYARGVMQRGDADATTEREAIMTLMRVSWGKDHPAFRQVFTSRFVPGASEEQMVWWDDLCRRTTTGPTMASLLAVRSHVDIQTLLPQVRVPTLVIHARGDLAVPASEGRLLAAGIPGAEYVELESVNHILLEDEPAWQRFRDTVLDFSGISGTSDSTNSPFAQLSLRERQILTLMGQGRSNLEIAEHLGISEKTVRNQASKLFDKLGVWTRAQAIVFANERGFKGEA
jgi:pimeloyl-ACP methyl ester carboxylesterase/DNA-binding CsgD family transcriptional regulator